MESSDHSKKRADNLSRLNKLLRKSEGELANLGRDERFELQKLSTREMIYELCDELTEHYPGVNPLVALLRDEAYRSRSNQMKVAEDLGMSYVHFNKVVTGHERIGASMAKRIRNRLGVDGNFILKYM